MHFSCQVSHSFPILSHLPSSPAPPKIKQNSREKEGSNKMRKVKEGMKLKILLWTLQWNPTSHATRFLFPYFSICKFSLQRVFGLFRSPWFPLQVRCCAPTRILLGHSTAALCFGDPCGFGSAGQVPFHVPADHRWGEY